MPRLSHRENMRAIILDLIPGVKQTALRIIPSLREGAHETLRITHAARL